MLARHMTLLGVSEEQGHVLVRLVHVLSRVPEANPYTLALGAGVLIVTTGTARISSRVPGALIGLVGAGLAVALFHLDGRGVSLLGALSLPLPHLALPTLPGMDQLSHMVQLALPWFASCRRQRWRARSRPTKETSRSLNRRIIGQSPTN